MTAIAAKIEAEALQLSEKERAELAYRLILSLDEESDSDAEAAWDAELERRMKSIESGESAGRPVEDVLAEIKAKYS